MLVNYFFQVCILVCQGIAQILEILFGKALYICHDYCYFTVLKPVNMKKLPVVILLFALIACNSKNDKSTTNKTSADSVTVSMKGIGDLKIGMEREKLEKLLGHKLKLPHLSADSNGTAADTVSFRYKDISYTATFMKDMMDDTTTDRPITMSEIKSNSPLLKTPSGISLGDDFGRIAGAYDGYRLNITPDYDYKKETPVKIKGKSQAWLFDEVTPTVIIFYMDTGKVASMGVMRFLGD